jgi:hypothetical protein
MSLAQSDRRVTLVTALGFVWIAAVIGLYALSASLDQSVLDWAIDSGDVLVSIACATLCFILWRAADKGEDLRRVWMLMGIGLGLWAIAEIFYATYELVLLEDTPTPSLADLLWVPAYIPLVMALWTRFRILRVPLTHGQWISLIGAFAVMGLMSIITVILPNLPGAEAMQSASGSAGDTANLFLGIFYGVGDLLIAFAAGLMIIALMGGRFSRVWALIAFGFFAISVADSMYYAGLANGLYSDAVPVTLFTATSDIAYFAGYVMIAFGLFEQAVLQRAV